MTPGPFRPRPSPHTRLRACRFPYAFGGEPLKLATQVNSLARVSRRIVRLRSSPLVLSCCQEFLRGESTLKSRTRLSPSGFRHFSLRASGTFQLSLTVLVRYRSWGVFRVGSRCLPASHGISDPCYSGYPASPSGLRLRGYHPLWPGFPATFGFTREAIMARSCNTTSPLDFSSGFSLP